MKTLGIIGGIGPESTVEYYRHLIATYRDRRPDGSAPPLILNSIDLHKMLAPIIAGPGHYHETIDYLIAEIRKLERASAEYAIIAANTPHIVFDQIAARAAIPLISIVDAACAEVRRRGMKQVALFGTRFTMQGRFYPEVFERAGLRIILPRVDEQAFIHDAYMNELLQNKVLEPTRARLIEIADRLSEHEEADAVLLGGTDLSLILYDGMSRRVPFLDTARIHAEAAIERMLA